MEAGAPHCRIERPAALPGKFRPGLALLVEAAGYAQATSGDLWEFAVGIDQLREVGLSDNDLRFLVRLGYVAHASEVCVARNKGRGFRPSGGLHFRPRTCFVLSPAGIAWVAGQARQPAYLASILALSIDFPSRLQYDVSNQVPFWDAAWRTLVFDGQVVKRFRWQAINQEKILSAFQDEGWPPRIDDPLAPSPEIVTKRRLSDAIKCLNRGQANRLVRFGGDGTGEGVIWEPLARHAASAMAATA